MSGNDSQQINVERLFTEEGSDPIDGAGGGFPVESQAVDTGVDFDVNTDPFPHCTRIHQCRDVKARNGRGKTRGERLVDLESKRGMEKDDLTGNTRSPQGNSFRHSRNAEAVNPLLAGDSGYGLGPMPISVGFHHQHDGSMRADGLTEQAQISPQSVAVDFNPCLFGSTTLHTSLLRADSADNSAESTGTAKG